MKILFVNKEEDPIDPMQIELLSALAKREGHETFLNILQHRNFAESLRKIRPDIVAYTGKTGEHKILFGANRYVKETYGDKIFTIMGGPHSTFNHSGIQLCGESDDEFQAFRRNLKDSRAGRQHVTTEKSQLDALCVGEGDDAWVELLRALGQKQNIDGIANIVTRNNRKKFPEPVLHNRRTCLDDLPYLDRELVYEKTFLGHFPMRSFMASRGCPFRCTYCFNYDWNQMYRRAGKLVKIHNRYSVDRLIAEIQNWREMESRRGYAKT
ncbi:MAG: hypothetical protein PHS88_07745, partial [Candidatus Omnitrophica bacterium]|nr:hypothetical protein [Candidatus Omnitrophota bacterium]